MDFVIGAMHAHALKPTEIHLPVEGQIAPDGRSVALSRFGCVAISRRNLGAVGGETWSPITARCAYGLKQAHARSFHTLSQGSFAALWSKLTK